MTSTLDDQRGVDRLRRLATAAAPSVAVRPDLAAVVLRRGRQQRTRRRRYVAGAAAGLFTVGALAAAALPGQGDYFRQYEPSGAMEPTIQVGEQVIVGKRLTVQRGDVVVFRFSLDGVDVNLDVISRVLGLPGDRVSCPDDGRGRCTSVLVNGEPLAEPYLAAGPGHPFAEILVPPNELFLAGDNRDQAVDSRTQGPFASEAVHGVAVRVEGADRRSRTIPGAPARPGSGDTDAIDPQAPVPGSRTVPGPP
jgi:signal peptidase I